MDEKMLRRMIASIVLFSIPLSSTTIHVGAADVAVQPTNRQIVNLEVRTYVFVHGCGEASWVWFRVAAMLQEVGFTTVAIDMVSHGIDKTSPDEVLSMSQYAKPLTSHLANVTGKVILVSHGLGGGPASYAMETFPEKISKAVFLSGVMPLTGEMVLDALKPTFPALMNTCFLLNYNGVNKTYPSSIVVNRTGAPNCYFNRSPPLDVALATNLMEDTPWAVFYDSIKLTNANYGSIDRYYIRQGLDRIIPYDIQQQIIAHNPPKQVFLLKNGDHCGFFSETPYLFTLLKQIAFL